MEINRDLGAAPARGYKHAAFSFLCLIIDFFRWKTKKLKLQPSESLLVREVQNLQIDEDSSHKSWDTAK